MRDLLSPYSIAATVRLLRDTFLGCFLLVEGDTDARLLKRFIDVAACQVLICFGRANVIQVVSILDQGGFVGHLGVIDKDFGALLNETFESNNIIVTDENDMEMTIFQTDVFDRVVHEYCNQNRVHTLQVAEGHSFREILLRSASKLGALRYLSRVREWHLTFDEMTIRYLPNGTVSIDIDRQIEHLRGRSRGTPMPGVQQVKEALEDVRQQYADPKLLAGGHDVCEIISKAIHDVCGRANVALARGGLAVEEVFRAAFSIENFLGTQLYAHIRAWERDHPGYRILPSAA
jgi:hypothetical protein